MRDEDCLDPDDPVWVQREQIAHALWEQEYCTTDGALARIARSRADAGRCAGGELRAIADFVLARAREVALAVAEEARDGGTRDEIEATVRAAEESAAAELGLWMHVSAGAADQRIEFACGLARRLPATLDALEAGSITERLAHILWTETRELDIAKAAWVERQVLSSAHTSTPAAFRRRVRRRVEQADADAVLKRHAAALKGRRVTLTPAADGMSWVSALLPAEDALAVYGVIDACAHERAPGDDRTLDERHADALVDLVTRPGNQNPRVGYVVHLHAGRTNGTGGEGASPERDDRFADLHGGGSIPTHRARSKADLTVHHPSVAVDIEALLADYNSRADVYRPSAKLKRAVRARDKHCRFPGAAGRRPAANSTTPWRSRSAAGRCTSTSPRSANTTTG